MFDAGGTPSQEIDGLKPRSIDTQTDGSKVEDYAHIVRREALQQEQAKLDIKKERPGKTAQLQREMLKSDVAVDIKLLNAIETLSEEREVREVLQSMTISLLRPFIALEKAGLLSSKDLLVNPQKVFEEASFKEVLRTMTPPLNNAETLAMKKFGDLMQKPNSKAFSLFLGSWPVFFQHIKQASEQAKKTVQELKDSVVLIQQKSGEQKKGLSQTDAVKPHSAIPGKDLLKRNPSQKESQKKESFLTSVVRNHPFISSALILGGTYALYKFLRSENKDQSEEKKETSWFSKIFNKKTLVVAGLAGLGIYSDFFTETLPVLLKCDVAKSKKIAGLISDGKLEEAFHTFIFEGGDENFDQYKALAEIVSKSTGRKISASGIQKVGQQKYADFVSPLWDAKKCLDEFLGSLRKATEEIPGVGKIAKFKNLIDNFQHQNGPELIKEIEIIHDYLLQHKNQIATLQLSPDATVLQVLAALNKVELAGNASEQQESDETEADIPDEIVEDAHGNQAGVDKKAAAELKKEFADKPNIQSFLSLYENNWENAFKHPIDFATNLYAACKADNVPMIVYGGAVMLGKADKWLVVTTFAPLKDAIVDLINLHPGDAVTHYIKGMAPIIAVFAVPRFLFNLKSGLMSGVAGGLKGIGQGLVFPYTVAKLHAKGLVKVTLGGKTVYRTVRGRLLELKSILANDSARAVALQQEMRFYAKTAEHYFRLYDASRPGTGANVKKLWIWASGENVMELKEKYLRRFVETYNALHKGKPGFKELDLLSGGDRDKAIDVMKDTVKEAAEARAKAKMQGKAGNNAPQELKTDGDGLTAKRTYRYYGSEVEVIESEIVAKTAEVEAQRASAGESAPTDAVEKTKWDAENRQRAIQTLAEQKMLTPVEIKDPASSVKRSGKVPAPRRFRFAGEEFALNDAEIKARLASGPKFSATASGAAPRGAAIATPGGALASSPHGAAPTTAPSASPPFTEADAIRELCIERAVEHVTVQDVRMRNGVYEYKIGGEWIEANTPTDPAKLEEMKTKFMENLAKNGKVVDWNKFLLEAKTLKYFAPLEKMMGTAFAVLMIYHLETAPDKSKAVAETAVGFGAFFAGMKATDKLIGQHLGPLNIGKVSIGRVAVRGVVDMLGGMAAAFGISKPIAEIVEEYYRKVPNHQQVSPEVISFIEKSTVRSSTRMVLSSLEGGLLRKGIQKIGWVGAEKLLATKIESSVFKKVGQFATKEAFVGVTKIVGSRSIKELSAKEFSLVLKEVVKGFGIKFIQKLARTLGLRGATVAAMIADDATFIGVVDDALAGVLAVTMAKDIIDIATLLVNTAKIQNDVQDRHQYPITKMDVIDTLSRRKLTQKLALEGLSLEQLSTLPEEKLMKMMDELGLTRLRVWRQGAPGAEVWDMRNGKIAGIVIEDDTGKVIAEIDSKGMQQLEEAMKDE